MRVDLNNRTKQEITASYYKHLQRQVQIQSSLFNKGLDNTLTNDLVPRDLGQLLEAKKEDQSMFPIIGFNGQVVRAAILLKLMRLGPFDAFIETGTYMGETCLLVATQTNLPVISCDLAHRSQPFAVTVADVFGPRVQLSMLDSRSFLANVCGKGIYDCPFFYLDAHWESDIPLLGELRIILSNVLTFLIVIDDFKVPHDAGFGFDGYGNVNLDWEYIAPTIEESERRLRVFYPAYPSEMETGFRRGFVTITSERLPLSVVDDLGHRFMKEYSVLPRH
jgi:hypothetical protein